ncbi:MAG: M56 family metallopeptidase [Acidobacteriota bacterium]
MTFLADLTIRSSLIVAAGLTAHALLHRRSAALRHFVLAAAVGAAGAATPLNGALPAWNPFPSVARSTSPRSAATHPTDAARSHAARATEIASAEAGQADAKQDSSVDRLLSVIWMVWIAGVLFSAAVLLAGFGRLARIGRRAERVQDGPWVRTTEEIAAAYGLRRRVVVLQTDAPDLLATWGSFRPRVLLPLDAREWRDDRVRVVLWHELAHIRRHDWAVQIAAEALRAICWFNPLIWMACDRLRRDSEQACDDEVLDAGVRPRDYAAHLLDLARICRRPGRAWASATPMARPSTLERRIAVMLNPRVNRQSLSLRAVITTMALLLLITLPAAAFRAGQSVLRPLEGAVYDPSGGVLPGVELKLEDAGQIKWQATSDAAGHFEFPAVQTGHYVLEASLMGFRPLRHELDLRSTRDWDRAITLQVGDLRESISVTTPRSATPPSAVPPGPKPVRVGGNIRVPRKLQDVRPVYPASMRDAGREGVVPLEAVIGRDGTVQSVRVLSANVHPDFATAAVDAVRQWVFSPTLLNGKPVDVVMTVTVAFSLAD